MSDQLDIINTMYFKPLYDTSGKNIKLKNRDALIYTVKNSTKDTTELVIQPVPEYTFYRTKTSNYTYPKICISRNEVEEIKVPYYLRQSEFAKAIGKFNEYKDIKQNYYMGLSDWLSDNIIASPYLYNVDMDIEDQLKLEFARKHPKGNPKFKKSYLDIEVDIYGYTDKLNTEIANRPINCIQFFYEPDMVEYVFLLDNPEIKRIREIRDDPTYVEKKLKPKLIDLKKFENENRKVSDDWLKLLFYDSEERMLIDFFKLIHELKPDFCGIWYMTFDIRYILNRLRYLKLNPYKICCHPDVPDEFKRINYYIDPDRTVDSHKAKKYNPDEHRLVDWCDIAGYTQFYCMRSMYSNIRTRYKENSYSLENICSKNLGVGKIPLYHYGLSIRTAAYMDYDLFLEYAITDTLRLFQLEDKNHDLESWFIYSGSTRLSKCHNKTIVLKNDIVEKILYPNNEVVGNNVKYSIWGKISGAMVAKEGLCIAVSKKVHGKDTTIYINCIDSDASSQYPSLSEILNIAKSTVYYKGTIIVRYVDGSETGLVIGEGDEFHQLLQTRVSSIFYLGEKFFNFPNVEQMNNLLLERIKND